MAGAVGDGAGAAGGIAGLPGAGTPAAGAPPAVAVNLKVELCQVAPERRVLGDSRIRSRPEIRVGQQEQWLADGWQRC